ncbi:DUF1016 N-terminal domain-containing protein [Curtobacterium sp. RRHDQ66]|uniref:DUF1016 N-terminal domain-containing protein n=1 Tax=Curtobacterium guangdongense TaxID=3413380 RepID=UPI003BF147B5
MPQLAAVEARRVSADAIVQQAVGQLPWGHITVLLDRLDYHDLRDWYAGQTAGHGWSRNVLEYTRRRKVRRAGGGDSGRPGTAGVPLQSERP